MPYPSLPFPPLLLLRPRLPALHRVASPFIVKGPRAIPSGNTVSKNSDIFTCQLGLTPPFVCYDPYQMRHAYNIDTLINAGFTGKGKTIVIVDAFQSPNIVD